MELRVLGPMEAVAGSRPIDLGSRRHRALLALMVIDAGKVVSVDRLIDCLWGEAPPGTAAKALQVYVSGLRKALEPDRPPGAPPQVLVTQAPGYVLRLASDAIDAACFEALVGQGHAELRGGRPAEARHALERGLALWRGSAYEDLAGEPFVEHEVVRLHELQATAAEVRISAMLALGRHAEAVPDANRMVAENPLREHRWGLLALAVYREGRRDEALRTLARARSTLGQELGLEPGPYLQRLERDIRAGSAAIELPLPDHKSSYEVRRVPLSSAIPTIRSLGFGATRAAETTRGAVLPAGARPHGFSLADIAPLVDRFTSSGNDPACYPETPFQLLYASSAELRPVGGGVVVTGTNSFRTSPGICLCAALFSVDDTPPCPGSFPTTLSDVPAYLFDEAHYGGRDFEVVVDGTSTRIGAEYLVGPCRREEDGSHFIHMAAFIGPLSPGRHTVTARGGVFGRGVAEAYGASFVQEEFTYTVDVLEPQ